MRVVLAGCALLIASGLIGRTEAHDAPPARQVQLPYTFQDEQGNQWIVQQNGSIGPGNNDVFDAGGTLFVNGSEAYNSPAATAGFDPARNEIVLPVVPLAGLHVSRRITLDGRGPWCRWIELFENRGLTPVHTRVRVNFDLGGSVQAAQTVTDEKSRQTLGLAVFDGNRGLAMLAAGRGAKFMPTITWQQNSDQVDMAYDLDVPARQTVAILHIQSIRASLDEADTFVRSTKEESLLKELPSDLAASVVNFPHPQQFPGDVEVLRGDLLDVVELRGGDRYKGTLVQQRYTVQAAYGTIDLPAQRVAAMVSIGEVHPSQLLLTIDGEAYGGILQPGPLQLELSSGQVTSLPLAAVARFGYRQRTGEPREVKPQYPLVLLGGGDRVGIRMPAEDMIVQTRYGSLRLRPESIAAVSFQADGQPVHEVVLSDGSHFAGLVSADRFVLTLRSTGKTASFATPTIVRLQLSAFPEDSADAPLLALSNGDRLVGSLGGRLSLETAFDTLDVDGPEVRALRRAGTGPDVQLTLWDGATLSGRLKGDIVRCALNCGSQVDVPVSLVEEYAQPRPSVPTRIVQRIRSAVSDLSSNDAGTRDRASALLISMGPPVADLLRSLSDTQSPDARQRVEQVLSSLDAATRPATPPVAPPAPVPAEAQ